MKRRQFLGAGLIAAAGIGLTASGFPAFARGPRRPTWENGITDQSIENGTFAIEALQNKIGVPGFMFTEIAWYMNFSQHLNADAVHNATDIGCVPTIILEPCYGENGPSAVADTLSKKLDAYLCDLAVCIRDLDCWVRIDLAPQPESEEQCYRMSPNDYQCFVRRVLGIFKAKCAKKVLWIFSFQACPGLPKHYAAYCSRDIARAALALGLQGANTGDPNESFDSIFLPAYQELAAVGGSSKPMLISHLSCTEFPAGSPTTKGAWLEAGIRSARSSKYPMLMGIRYFNAGEQPEHLDSSQGALHGYAAGLA